MQAVHDRVATSSAGNYNTRSVTEAVDSRSGREGVSCTADGDGGVERGVTLPQSAQSALEESTLSNNALLSSRGTAAETLIPSVPPTEVTNGHRGSVDSTVAFGDLLSSRQEVSSLSATPITSPGNQIYFSLSNLPGNRIGSNPQLNHRQQPQQGGQVRSSQVSEASPLSQERPLADDTGSARACSLPPIETTPSQSRGIRELQGGETETQPASSYSLSSLPVEAVGAQGSAHSRRPAGGGAVQEGRSDALRRCQASVAALSSTKATKSIASRFGWRNLFGSGSSSSSSSSTSSSDSGGEDPDLRGSNSYPKHPTSASVCDQSVSAASPSGASSSARPAARDGAVAGTKNRKNKKWLMTRFFRSVVFSDSSSTYSEDNDSDDDIRADRGRSAKACVKSSVRDQTQGADVAHTSSLPDIAGAANRSRTVQGGIRTSRTAENIRAVTETHGLSNGQPLSQSTSGNIQSLAADRLGPGTSTVQTGAVCVRRPSTSSQTQPKEVGAVSTVDNQPDTQGCRPRVIPGIPQGGMPTRNLVVLESKIAGPLNSLGSLNHDEQLYVERGEGQPAIDSNRLCLPSETRADQLSDLTGCLSSQRGTDAQNSYHIQPGDDSPRTIYDNLSPNRNTSQPFPFRSESESRRWESSETTRPGAAQPSVGEAVSRYDNYNSSAGEAQGHRSIHGIPSSAEVLHDISSLKNNTSRQNQRPGNQCLDQSSLISQEELSPDQPRNCEANHSLTLYDNVESREVNLGLFSLRRSVAERDRGTEIEDLKTGLEHQDYCQGEPQVAATMENAGTASLVSSVDEPSLLASSHVEAQTPQAAQRSAALHLGELQAQDMPHLVGLPSQDSSCHTKRISLGAGASNYDNFNQADAEVSGDVPGHADPIKSCHVVQCSEGLGVARHTDSPGLFCQAGGECSGSSHGHQVYRGAEAEPGRANPSANVRKASYQATNDSLLESGPNGPFKSSQCTENNNNDDSYKSAHFRVPQSGATHKDDHNDDADVEDDDDEENAHSSSAMLKTKKKKPRSKFTKFLTSLLSLSSSSEDDNDYCREDAEDSGTTSSKSSDW